MNTQKNAPMASAPLIYDKEGNIAWDQMWTDFCVLATQGGPPHRQTKLLYHPDTNTNSEAYKHAVNEIMRAYKMLIPYVITHTHNGWIMIQLQSSNMANWFSEIINSENVECTNNKKSISIPVSDTYTIKEIKNVVTVVAKAHHYWTHRTWFAKSVIHLFNKDLEKGVWE